LLQQCGTKQPGDGDDVKHKSTGLLFSLPPKIVTGPPGVHDNFVDLVVLDHGLPEVLRNLNAPYPTPKYKESEVDKKFTNLTTNEVLGNYFAPPQHPL